MRMKIIETTKTNVHSMRNAIQFHIFKMNFECVKVSAELRECWVSIQFRHPVRCDTFSFCHFHVCLHHADGTVVYMRVWTKFDLFHYRCEKSTYFVGRSLWASWTCHLRQFIIHHLNWLYRLRRELYLNWDVSHLFIFFVYSRCVHNADYR